MRVILDTNVLLSALISPAGAPGRVLDAWIARRFTLISHAIQIDELRRASRREKVSALVRSAVVGQLVNRVAMLAELSARLPYVQRSRDPHDDFLLALCEAGTADRLVTGDKADVLALERHGPARIVSVAAFAAELGI